MIFFAEIKTKKIQQTFLVFLLLLILGFSFLTLAEENSNSSKNIFLDSDQDGISDEEERTYGTNPRNKDSDGDGYSDGVEIKSGYDPLKPSPGDKIIPEETTLEATSLSEENLTKKLAKEILVMAEDAQINQEVVTSESLQSILNDTFYASTEEDLEENFTPLISEDEIKIKEQNYGHFSKEKQTRKKKEDAIEYLTAAYYVMASNSPEPITSGSNIGSAINSVTQKIIQAFTTRNINKVGGLKESGEKIVSQMKDVEVPEDMLDIHISALSFAKYAIEMEKFITPNAADPISDIQNLSNVSGLISNMMAFTTQVEEKLSEYELTDEDITDRLEEMEIDFF